MPTKEEVSLTLQDQNTIIDEYIDATNDKDVKSLLNKYNLSTRKLNGILRQSSPRLQEIFATKCSLDVYKENRFITEIKEKSFLYLLDQLSKALESENSLAYLDKITKMLETVDKIDRLNRGESTENIKSSTTSTTTTVNISELMKQLQTPEEKMNYMMKKMEEIKFANYNNK